MPRRTGPGFTRTNVGTGEEIGADNDLLRELLDVTKGQTKTLAETLKNIQKSLEAIAKKATARRGSREEIFNEVDFIPPGTARTPSGRRSTTKDPYGCANEFKALIRSVDTLKRAVLTRWVGRMDSADAMLGAAAGATFGGMAGGTGTHGGGPGSRGGRPRGDPAYWSSWKDEFSRHERRKAILPGLMKGTHSLRDVLKEAHESLKVGLVKPFKSIGPTLFGAIERLGIRFATLAEVVKDTTKRFEEFNKNVGGAGTFSFTEYMLDDFVRAIRHGIGEGGVFASDSYRNTVDFVRRNAQEGHISPLQMTGMSPEQMSGFLAQARNAPAFGGQMQIYGRQGFKDFEDTLDEMMELNKLAGIKDDLHYTTAFKNTEAQLETLRLVAANTGLTVDEVRKLTKNQDEEIAYQAALGKLTPQETGRVKSLETMLAASGPGGQHALKRLKGMIASGMFGANPMPIGWYLSQHPEAIIGETQGGGLASRDIDIFRSAISGRASLTDTINRLRREGATTRGINRGLITPVLQAMPGTEEYLSGMAQGDTLKISKSAIERAKQNDPVFQYYHKFEEIFSNQTILLEIIAAAATLTAVSLAGKSVFRMIGGALGKVFGHGDVGALAKGAAGAADGAGEAVGTAGAATALGRAGGTLGGLSKLGGGLTGGLLGGAMTYWQTGDWWKAIGAGAGGALGAGLGAMLGLPGAMAGGYVGSELGGWGGGKLEGLLMGKPDTANQTGPETAAAGFQQQSNEVLKRTMAWQDDTVHLLASILNELQEQTDALDDIDAGTNKSAAHLAELNKRREGFQQIRVADQSHNYQANRPNTGGYWPAPSP